MFKSDIPRGTSHTNSNNKVVTKHFSGATTDDMKSCLQPTVLHYMKILELATSYKSYSNILISGTVPSRDKLNAKAAQVNSFLKNECGKRNICFINISNINPSYHFHQSGIYLEKSGTNRLIENLLLALSKFDS